MEKLLNLFKATFWPNIIIIVLGVVISLLLYHCKYKKTRSRQLLNSLPGVWTSLGLLGTFMSICWSLSALTTSSESANNIGKTATEASGQSIDIISIISDIIPAFTTSIIGLFGALVATILIKLVYAKEDAKIDEQSGGKSMEEYIFKTCSNTSTIAEELRLQREQNRENNEKLSTSLTEQREILTKFVDGFVDRMDAIFNQMEDSVSRQINTFGERQFSNSTSLIEGIVSKLASTSEKLLENQQVNVEKMLDGTTAELQNISTSVSQNMSSMASGTISALQTMQTSQQDKFETIITEQNRFYDTINLQMTEQSKHAIDSNNTIISELRGSMSGFIAQIRESIENNVKMLQESYQFIDSHIAQIKSDYEQAALSFTDAVQIAHNTNEGFAKTMNCVDDSLKYVVDTNQKISDVLNILDSRQTNIDNLVSRINEINSAIETLQKLESAINKIPR